MTRKEIITVPAVERRLKILAGATGLTGPSCCKAYVRASLEIAVTFLADRFAINLPMESAPACCYSSKHPHGCRESQCPYFVFPRPC